MNKVWAYLKQLSSWENEKDQDQFEETVKKLLNYHNVAIVVGFLRGKQIQTLPLTNPSTMSTLWWFKQPPIVRVKIQTYFLEVVVTSNLSRGSCYFKQIKPFINKVYQNTSTTLRDIYKNNIKSPMNISEKLKNREL